MRRRLVPLSCSGFSLLRGCACRMPYTRCVSYSACRYEGKKALPRKSASDADQTGLPDESATPSAEAYRALIHDLLLYRRETLVPVVAALQKERKLLDKRLEELDQKVEQLSLIREEIRLLVTKHKSEEQVELQKVLHKMSLMGEKKQDTTAPKARSRDTELKF